MKTEQMYRLRIEQSDGSAKGYTRTYAQALEEMRQAEKSTEFCGYVKDAATNRYVSLDNLDWIKFSLVEIA